MQKKDDDDDDENACRTEARRQTSTAARAQSNVILSLSRDSNLTINSELTTSISDVDHRNSAGTATSTSPTTPPANNDDSNTHDGDEEADDLIILESEAAMQSSPAIRQQSNLILELTRNSSENNSMLLNSLAENDDTNDEPSELESITHENRKTKQKKRKETMEAPSTISSVKDETTSGRSNNNDDDDELATVAVNTTPPGACRVKGTNERESGSTTLPPPTPSQPQQHESVDDDQISMTSETDDSSLIHRVAEAQVVVEDVPVVAEVISRDDLISEVRDQVLVEAGMMLPSSTTRRHSSNIHNGGVNDNDKDDDMVRHSEIGRERDKWRRVFWVTFIVCGCFVLILASALTVGLVFGLRDGDGGNGGNKDRSSSDEEAPTPAPSFSVESGGTSTTSPQDDNNVVGSLPLSEEEAIAQLRERLIPLLANYGSPEQAEATNDKIERSNQLAKALKHLANDPSWMDYSDRRLVRRFVLGVLHLGTAESQQAGKPNWINDNNWMDYNVHECLWYGVVTPTVSGDDGPNGEGCDALPDDTSIGLHLPNNNLHGKIPSEIIYLADTLVSINFSGNSITAFPTIPPVFEAFPNLESLILRDNQIEGELKNGNNNNNICGPPGDDLCSVLEDSVLTELDLGNNLFFGELPRLLSSLRNLEVLRVDGNADITGTIPSSYCDMVQLKELTVLDTSIVGEMPRCFCDRTGNNNFWAEADCRRGQFSCDCCEGFGCGG